MCIIAWNRYEGGTRNRSKEQEVWADVPEWMIEQGHYDSADSIEVLDAVMVRGRGATNES